MSENASPPDRIYLQWWGDGEPSTEPPSPNDVTWCADEVFAQDIEYRIVKKRKRKAGGE